MERPKWHAFTSGLIIFITGVLIYAAGFLMLRLKFVEIQNYTDGGVTYFSQPLALNPSGPIGVAIDFYKPAFLLETKYYGADNLVINGWGVGMRTWQFPTPQSDP